MLDKAARASLNLSSPPDERREALEFVQRGYAPTASDMPPMGDVNQLVTHCVNAYEEQAMVKGHGMEGGAWSGSAIQRPKRGVLEPKTIFVDEMGLFGSTPGGYRRRPSQFSSDHLRLMVEQTPVLNAIICRRQRTIKRFLRPNERDRDIGFEIRKKDDERPLRANDDKMEFQLNEYILHSGMESDPVRMKRLRRDSLTAFIDRSVRDLLTLDAWTIEMVMTRNNQQLAGYHAIDAGSIYLVSESGYDGNDKITAIQLVNSMPTTTYTEEELVYLMQSPRTDILHAGYGYPPTEMVVKAITGYLNALTYNLKGFDSNSIPKGLLTLYGSYDSNQLAAFKAQWNAMVRGVNNTWALPVMVSDSKENAAHFEKIGNDFSEMYFAKWMTLLTSIICSIYGMDPTEVYSEAFHSGKSSLSGSDRAEALADARDTGLEPLMTFLETSITANILGRVDPDYKFRFFGLQPVDRAWRQESLKLTATIDEARAAEGKEPHNDPVMGGAPMNPSLMGLYMQQVQAQQAQEQQQMQEGQPGQQQGGEGEPQPDGGQGQQEGNEDNENGAQPEESGGEETAKRDEPELEEQGDREQEDEEDEQKIVRGQKSTMTKSFHSRHDVAVMG